MISDKKLKKLEKILGQDTLQYLNELEAGDLQAKLISAEMSIKEAKEQLEANPKFQELKENLKALSESAKEVNKRQSAIIQWVLHLLEGKEQ